MRFFLIIVYFYNDYKVSTLSGKNKGLSRYSVGKSIYFASFFIMKYICNVEIKRNMKKENSFSSPHSRLSCRQMHRKNKPGRLKIA